MILHPPYCQPDFSDRRLMVRFTYTYPCGTTTQKVVVPVSPFFGTSDSRPAEGPQHYFSCYDCGESKYRDFSIKDIKGWEPLPEEPV